MVTMESEYDIYNQYPIEIDNTYCGDNCDDEKNYFESKKHWHFGRTSYCNIILDSDKLTNDCDDDNCVMCIKGQKTCIVCKYLFELLEGGGKKCLNENEISQTYATDLAEETTILNVETTISNVETTIPKVKTTIPNIETTIPKVETTIPKVKTTILNEKTTIPNIKNKSIETTIFKNLDTIIKDNITINNETNCILNNECKNKEITLQQIDEIKKNLLNSNYTKENTIIKSNKVIVQISTLEDQKNSDDPDTSNIDLGECEDILKKEYKSVISLYREDPAEFLSQQGKSLFLTQPSSCSRYISEHDSFLLGQPVICIF